MEVGKPIRVRADVIIGFIIVRAHAKGILQSPTVNSKFLRC